MEADQGLRILFVEDVRSDYEMEERELRRQGLAFTSMRVDTRADFLQALDAFQPELILSDYSMPSFDGMQALLLSLQHDPSIPFIIITGSMNEETAVACLKAGATDYVIKEHLGRLPFAVEDALRQKKTRRDKEEAEQALRVSEERFRSVVEQAEDGIAIIDQQGTIIVWNRSKERISGLSREDVLGRPLWDVHLQFATDEEKAAPHAYEHVKARIEEFLKTGTAPWLNEAEREVQQPNGARLVVQTVVFPIKTDKGRLFCSTMRDITRTRRAEEQMRLQSAALEAAANAIVITDRAGTIEWANHAFSALSGYTTLEAVGKNPRELVKSGQHAAAFYKQLWDTILEGQVWHGEMTNRRKDGTYYSEEMTITPLVNERSDITHFIAVKQDISERKLAEETLRQRLAELEALHNVSTTLRSAATVDEALPLLLDETLAALATDAGVISLYDPGRGELQVTAARGWLRQVDLTPLKAGEGLAGTVLATGQAIYSPDLANDPLLWAPNSRHVPAGWCGACVPIRSSAATVAVLMVSLPLPRQVTAQQISLLESVAEMAGVAIQRMRLHEEIVRQLEYVEALHEIDLAISSSFDLRVTLALLLGHVIEQMGVDAADVLLLHPQLQSLEYAAGQGFRTPTILKASVRLGDSLAGRVAFERRPVQILGAASIEQRPNLAALWSHEGFVFYCGIPLIAKGEVKGVLEVFQRSPFSPGADWLASLETMAGPAAIAIDNAQLFDGLQRANLDLSLAYAATIEGWSRALDLRDKETEGHTERVTDMTMQLARRMGVGDAEIVPIQRGALLHDIGKMGVADAILLKPGKLSDEEWIIMRQHPLLAYQLLSPIAYLRDSLDIPYCHHEKWDGTGYPRGLIGEQIPLAARVFAVVDVWDALLSDRPYRKGWLRADVVAHIRCQSGTHFDPRVADAFLTLIRE